MRFPLLALGAWALAAAAQAAPPAPADAAALKALAEATDAAWNAKNAQGMARHFAPGATLMVAGAGPVRTGQGDIRAYFERMFAQRQGELRHVSEVLGTDLAAPDLAVNDVEVRVEARQADGSWTTVRRFHNLSMAKRQGGEWKLVAVRAYPIG